MSRIFGRRPASVEGAGTSHPPFDVLVLAAPKDYVMLPFVLRGIARNVAGYTDVYLCTPTPVETLRLPVAVRPLLDAHVLPVDRTRWRYRPDWVCQQFLKLLQEATPNDLYLVVDADTIVSEPLPLFEGGRPVWWTGLDQLCEAYFRFSRTMLGVDRVYDHTFIADLFFFSRALVEEMLASGGYTRESFVERSFAVIEEGCRPSEAELYMNYVYAHHPEAYVIRELRTAFVGKELDDAGVEPWTRREIARTIRAMRRRRLQTFSLHSWARDSGDAAARGHDDRAAAETPRR